MRIKEFSLLIFFVGIFFASTLAISTTLAHYDDAVIAYSFNEDQDSEIKFTGIATEYHKGSGFGSASYWTVDVDEVISGPQPWSNQVDVITKQAVAPPWGSVEQDIEEGDKVEVYAKYLQWLVNPERNSVTLNGSEDYYIKVSSIDSGTLFGLYGIAIALTGTAVAAVIIIIVHFIFRNRKLKMLSSSTITLLNY
ncbi:MAG: hypothetical protein L6N94_02060 [Candidatus Methylarchaceae archaeon HK01M]|nr:hypothetical protein [Candidatus Methylarchaceae archaeon HK01M]